MQNGFQTYHNDNKNDQVEGDPYSLVEEPLVLPESIDLLLHDQIGECNIVNSRENDSHDDHIAQAVEHAQLSLLLLVLQVLDGIQQGLKDPEVDQRVQGGGRDDSPEVHLSDSGESGGNGVPQGEAEVNNTHQNHLPDTLQLGGGHTQTLGNHQTQAASHSVSAGRGDQGEDSDTGSVGSLSVVVQQTNQLDDGVEQEGDGHHGDHHVHAHQLLAVDTAHSQPNHGDDGVSEQDELGEGKNAVHTGGKVSIRTHHDGRSVDHQVLGIRVTHTNHHPVLAFLGNIVMKSDALLLTTIR